MKLESYEISTALSAGDIPAAIRLLADHFGLPQPGDMPVKIISKNASSAGVRLLFWCGDDFYEWSSTSGFDRGAHAYPLESERESRTIDSIILWE